MGAVIAIYIIIILIGLIPFLLIFMEEFRDFEQITEDGFFKFVFLPQFYIYESLSAEIKKSGIILLEILYTLFYSIYNFILLLIALIFITFHLAVQIFVKIFGKDIEE